MSKVIDLGEARARKKVAPDPPDRHPDFELQGWLKDGEIDWICFSKSDTWPEDWGDTKEIAALADAAWTWAARKEVEWGDQPACWYMVDKSGFRTGLVNTEILTGTNWRHGLWMLRQWARVTLWWWKYTWRAARGRG